MTDINQFDDRTSRMLIESLRDRRRRAQFVSSSVPTSELEDMGFLFITPVGGIPARSGDVCGKATCTRYILKDNDNLEEDQVSNRTEETIWNVEEGDKIPGGIVIRVYRICDKLVADPYNAAPPKLKFRSNEPIANRKFTATGLIGEYGTQNIVDPHNLWANVTTGCVGTAYRNRFNEWEVETCSLPANEVTVSLADTLKSTDTTATGTLEGSYYLRSTYPNVMEPPELGECDGYCEYTWNRSLESWSLSASCDGGCVCVDPPTDEPADEDDETRRFPCRSSGVRTIEFENTWKLDGMCNSLAILRRVTDAKFGEPQANDFTATPAPDGSATEARWEIVAVQNRKARIIQFTYRIGGGAPTVSDFWNGEDPTECEPVDVIYPLGTPCDFDQVLADYDPRTDKYVARDTDSSMLGTPVEATPVTAIANDDCGIELTKSKYLVFLSKDEEEDCVEENTTSLVQLGTSMPAIVAMSSDECGKINYAFQYFRAFICDGDIGFGSFAINFGDASFVSDIAWGDAPTCTGYSTWTYTQGSSCAGGTILCYWSVEYQEWFASGVCPAGCELETPLTDFAPPADPEVYEERTVNCVQTTPDDWVLTTECPAGCETEKPAIPDPVPAYNDIDTSPCTSAGAQQTKCGLLVTKTPFADLCPDYYYGPALVTTHEPMPLVQVPLVRDVYLDSNLEVPKALVWVCGYEDITASHVLAGPCGPDPEPPASCSGTVRVLWSAYYQMWIQIDHCQAGCRMETLLEDLTDPVDPTIDQEELINCIAE